MKRIKRIIAKAKIMIAFFTFVHCHYEGCRNSEKYYKKKRNICSTE